MKRGEKDRELELAMKTSSELEPVQAQREATLGAKILILFLSISIGLSWGAIAFAAPIMM